jgi:hypothetical protein
MSTGVLDDLRDGINLNLAPLTVEQYHLMIRDGILSDAWVASKPLFLQVQGPIVIGETSEPEPDCCLVRGSPDDFAENIPHPADVLAVFEVAFSSLLSDRRTKQRLYASEEIPIYVIVNLQDEMVEVLTEPSAGDQKYLTEFIFRQSETVAIDLSQFGQLSFSVENVI